MVIPVAYIIIKVYVEERVASFDPKTALASPEVPQPDIADADNAALLYIDAFTTMQQAPIEMILIRRWLPPFDRSWWTAVAIAERRNAECLKLIARATSLPSCNWKQALAQRPDPDEPRPTFNAITLLTQTATYAHLKGDDTTALRRLCDAAALVQRAPEPLRVAMIRENRIHLYATTILIAPELKLSTDEDRALARELVDRLQSVRLAAMSAVVIESNPDFDGMGFHWDPFSVRLELMALFKDVRRVKSAMDTAANPGIAWLLTDNIPLEFKRSPRHSRDVILPDYPRYQFLHSAASVSLATRLFVHDHSRLPNQLSELTPTYLPKLPIDPYDKTGAPLRYLVTRHRDGQPRPILYSVGRDQSDDIAAGRVSMIGSAFFPNRQTLPDVLVDLLPRSPLGEDRSAPSP